MPHHLTFLREALDLAGRRRGFTNGNPAVGAVVVRDGRVVARGFHHGAGHPHAEVEALRSLSGTSAGTALYISLEPCCFEGRTPACTDLIIESKIAHVFYAFPDPNPQVSGRGQSALRQAGIACDYLPLPAVDEFYQSYGHWWKHRTPFVISKLAMSLDGKIATRAGVPIALTENECQTFTHENRRRADAILTTARTINSDNPRLNVRLSSEIISKKVYVLDRTLQTSPGSLLFQTSEVVLIHGPLTPVENERRKNFPPSVTLRQMTVDHGRLNLKSVLQFIGEQGAHELWVEAGGTLFQTLISEGLTQKSYLYVAPKWVGESGLPAFSYFNNWEKARRLRWNPRGRDVVAEIDWEN
jgi:diaminohydroxyphosphoribosylaminopyrimidine deaminase/5-amino-6-(5-phosphoribosylamino)uracil reductase